MTDLPQIPERAGMTPTQTSATQVHAELLARLPDIMAKVRAGEFGPIARPVITELCAAISALASPTAGAASDGVREALASASRDLDLIANAVCCGGSVSPDYALKAAASARAALAAMPAPASSSGVAGLSARDLFEIARSCFNYAPCGTPDGNAWERSETGRLLMKAMERIAEHINAAGGMGDEAMREVRKALEAQELAEDARETCECEGEGQWEHCGPCSERFGAAICLRRAALERLAARPAPASSPSDGEAVRVLAAIEAAKREWHCSGDDCTAYDHGRDEGLRIARDAIAKALAAMPAPASSSDERAKVVAWLREQMLDATARSIMPAEYDSQVFKACGEARAFRKAADAIEGGDHLATDEARHADRPHPLDSSGASK